MGENGEERVRGIERKQQQGSGGKERQKLARTWPITNGEQKLGDWLCRGDPSCAVQRNTLGVEATRPGALSRWPASRAECVGLMVDGRKWRIGRLEEERGSCVCVEDYYYYYYYYKSKVCND